MGVDMGQFGYQAVANSCVRQEEGLELLAEMKVTRYRLIELSNSFTL